MADIITFDRKVTVPPVQYSVAVTLEPGNLAFTLSEINTDARSLLKIASELERIAQIIRTDVVVGN
jgi:hypothetical protein